MNTDLPLKKVDLTVINKVLVSAYKAAGFIILALLLSGLFYFIGLNIFFFVNHSWVSPTILSPTDERVITLSSQLTQQSMMRDKLVSERAELMARLAEAERTVLVMESFRSQLSSAVASDLQMRKVELSRTASVSQEFRSRKPEIVQTNRKFSEVSRTKADQLWSAHLVDSDGYVNAGHQIAQAMETNLGLDREQLQLESRARSLQREVEAFSALSSEISPPKTADNQSNSRGPVGVKAQGPHLNYETLRLMGEHNQSTAQLARARADREVLTQAIETNQASTARYDKLLKTIHESPYLKATEGNVNVAFVPYNNLSGVKQGAAIYGCSLGVVWCKKIGEVAEVLEGEVTGHHPMRNQLERGLLVRMELADSRWAKERVVFIGRSPLFL